MDLEDQYEGHDHFGNLLDFSDIGESRRQGSLYELSVSRDKLNLSEKERTREESYEDIMKKVNQAKVDQAHLHHLLGALKQRTYDQYLGRFQDQFEALNQENQSLRAELKQGAAKLRDDRSERLSNRSSFKVRSSVNNVYGDENKKTHTKASRNQVSPNMIVKKKDPKLTESTSNLGRSQVHSPKHHKRRESQLTERKQEEGNEPATPYNASYNDSKYSSFRESVSKDNLKQEAENKNVFVKILNKMLKDEMLHDHEKYGQVYLESTRKPVETPKQEIVYINSMEQEIKETNEKLQILKLVLNRYQTEIEGMNVNIKSVSDFTSKLFSVKGRYVEMERRCEQLINLRKEVDEKENMLNAKKLERKGSGGSESKQIASMETLIRIFTNNASKIFPGQSSKLYCVYYREVKELFRFEKEDKCRKQQKMVKVKEIIDNIRESRQKFNQLIQIYEGRIGKLEERINRVRQQQTVAQGAHSNKK